MKRIFFKTMFIVAAGLIFSGCKKPDSWSARGMEGVYTGTYTWTNLNQGWSADSSPEIVLKKGKYSYKGLSNDGYFDAGSGTFTVNGNKIKFDLKEYDSPSVSIGVVEEWLLQGEYQYEFDGKKLILSKSATVLDNQFKYVFELVK